MARSLGPALRAPRPRRRAGVAERIPVSVLGAEERLGALVRHQLRRGFRAPDLCELGLVLVQWPGESAHARLRGRAAAWMRDVLGWTGLGGHVGYDDTAGLTIMGGSIDPSWPPRPSAASSSAPACRPPR